MLQENFVSLFFWRENILSRRSHQYEHSLLRDQLLETNHLVAGLRKNYS